MQVPLNHANVHYFRLGPSLLTFGVFIRFKKSRRARSKIVSRKVYRNKQGEEVKLRHVLEKVSVWVKGIINIVDVGVSFDQSGHAALPWGIVKYLTTVRDHAVRVPKPTNTREYRLASQISMCSAVLWKALNLVLALWRDMSSSKNYIYTMSVKQHPDCRKLLETSTQTFSLTWQESRLTSQAVLVVSARLRLTNGVGICYT